MDKYCTFCMKHEKVAMRREGINEGTDQYVNRMARLAVETVKPIFWECNLVRPIIMEICRDMGWENMGKNDFMIEREEGSWLKNEWGIIIKHWIKYWIYGKKMQNKMPNINDMREGIQNFIQGMGKQTRKYSRINFGENLEGI